MSETLSIKISPLEKAKLQKIAEVRAVTMSQLLREGLQKVINTSADEDGAAAKDQAMKILEDFWSSTPGGPGDLSTNKKHMEDFGKS